MQQKLNISAKAESIAGEIKDYACLIIVTANYPMHAACAIIVRAVTTWFISLKANYFCSGENTSIISI